MKNLLKFLSESNAIEGVYDDVSLENAKKAWDYIIEQDKLTPENINRTHSILMANHLFERCLGKFRKVDVFVGGRRGLDWKLIPEAMVLWCKNNYGEKTKEEVKKLHVSYEKIHPHIDGNGRTGRILMSWKRVKCGFDILVIKEAERHNYYKWFK